MHFKSLYVAVVVALSAVEVAAHAAIAPALGVAKDPVRNDAQRPSKQSPCGNIDIASNIDSSTAVTADASGVFKTSITNFNGGQDGSREVTLQVDASGSGKSFVAGQVTTNGDAAPDTTGTQPIVASLPAGTKCTGGAAGNLCLASFTTLGGFGNCVVVQQGAGGAGAGAAAGGAGAGAGNAGAADGAGSAAAAGKAGKQGGAQAGKQDNAQSGKQAGKQADKQAAGTRKARAVLRESS